MKEYAIGLYEKAMPATFTWREKLNCAKECGYDFLEISIDETEEKLSRLNWSKEERKELCDLMQECEIPIRSMCLSGHRKFPFGATDPKVRERSLDIMKGALELADDLGIRIIQLAGYDVYYEESTEETAAYFLENLKEAVRMASIHGVILGFETMETEFMNTVGKSMDYIKRINSPYLGSYPDSGNIVNAAYQYHTDVYEDLASGAGHVFALHLKESLPGVYREVPFFTGHVNFQKLVETAWKIGVRRYSTEMWYVGQENWKEDIITVNTTIRSYLDDLSSDHEA